MFEHFYKNTDFSDVVLVLKGDDTETRVPSHGLVLCTHAKDYFGASVRWEHTAGSKRKRTDETSAQEGSVELTIVGWQNDMRAAEDFVEFLYKGMESKSTCSEWGINFLDSPAESNPLRVHNLIGTLDAYGAHGCLRAIVDRVFDTSDWLGAAIKTLPPPVVESDDIQKRFLHKFEGDPEFSTAMCDTLGTWKSLPLGLATKLMSSKLLKVISEDVMLDFLMTAWETFSLAWMPDAWKDLLARLVIPALSQRALAALTVHGGQWGGLWHCMGPDGKLRVQECLWGGKGDNVVERPPYEKDKRTSVPVGRDEGVFTVYWDVRVDDDVRKSATARARTFPGFRAMSLPFVDVQPMYWRKSEHLHVGVCVSVKHSVLRAAMFCPGSIECKDWYVSTYNGWFKGPSEARGRRQSGDFAGEIRLGVRMDRAYNRG